MGLAETHNSSAWRSWESWLWCLGLLWPKESSRTCASFWPSAEFEAFKNFVRVCTLVQRKRCQLVCLDESGSAVSAVSVSLWENPVPHPTWSVAQTARTFPCPCQELQLKNQLAKLSAGVSGQGRLFCRHLQKQNLALAYQQSCYRSHYWACCFVSFGGSCDSMYHPTASKNVLWTTELAGFGFHYPGGKTGKML